MMASGNSEAIAQARAAMAHFTRKVIEAGEVGVRSRLKYVANHAVALHNAAAETLAYADALGLDRDTTYDLLSTGAGQSKISDLRMPLMISGAYDPPTATLKMFEKDLTVVGDDLRRLKLMAPLFDAGKPCIKRPPFSCHGPAIPHRCSKCIGRKNSSHPARRCPDPTVQGNRRWPR